MNKYDYYIVVCNGAKFTFDNEQDTAQMVAALANVCDSPDWTVYGSHNPGIAQFQIANGRNEADGSYWITQNQGEKWVSMKVANIAQ